MATNEPESNKQSSIHVAAGDRNEKQTPVTVAGGWGGLHISPEIDEGGSENDEACEPEPNTSNAEGRCAFMQRFENNFPRLYHTLFSVLIPVFAIIPMAILCGYFLCELEAPNEKLSNDAAMETFATNWIRVDELSNHTYRYFNECLDTFDAVSGDMVNATEYRAHVSKCQSDIEESLAENAAGLFEKLIEDMEGSITFDWTRCKLNETSSTLEVVQRGNFIETWLDDFTYLWQKYESEKDPDEDPEVESIDKAVADASGSEICDGNVAGGAIFWWTIMTTVGYGNTAPTTDGGRALIFTMGFVTILLFTAIIGNAGYVMLVIFDDFFQRCNLQRLVRGGFAIIFWLVMFFLWLLAIAGIAIQRDKDRYGELSSLSLGDAYWFSFITGTTVGLGDFHMRHDVITMGDMFYIPFIFLGAFVLLSNFLYKLSDVVGPMLSSGNSLGDLLDKRRKDKRGKDKSEGERTTAVHPPQDSSIRSDFKDNADG